jgi:hypothetical protein
VTVKELRDKLSYMPDECEVLIALSKEEIIAVEKEPVINTFIFNRQCLKCGEEDFDCDCAIEQVFLRTK